jgi:S-adenosylhomocysteine hydrolase
MSKYLQDPEYLFSILTMLVKKNGGKIIITDKEMKNVKSGDLIGMYYEPKTGNLILKEVDPEDMLKAKTIVNDTVDVEYDN